jgi:S-DNA-T family DNA segregation ATPase FtsK/SpoIIIE
MAESFTDEQAEVFASILAKLKGLGVGFLQPLGVVAGPVITGYRFTVPNHISVSKVFSKTEDLKMAIGQESIDIRQVGNELVIYVPNKDRKVVDFKEMLWWLLKSDEVKNAAIPLVLGINPAGEKTVVDLVTLPHLLIAGATGSGKSVLESSLLASLAMSKTPEELQVYLVDTKRVDLTLFEKLPHVVDVVKDIQDWYPTINGIKEIINRRLKQLEFAGVRNIKEYNLISPSKMPYVLVLIDEMADLFGRDEQYREQRKRAYKEAIANEDDSVEKFLEPKPLDILGSCIAIARATGVHFIVCTQRTSVDIISGTVKNNFPARISLRVPTSTDSRTILGQGGAENLLGRGDMLVKIPDEDVVRRYHGPFVKLEDITQILYSRKDILRMVG